MSVGTINQTTSSGVSALDGNNVGNVGNFNGRTVTLGKNPVVNISETSSFKGEWKSMSERNVKSVNGPQS